MRAASLFAVFLVAKLALLGASPLPESGWAPLAYVWQDLAAALVFAGLDWALARWRLGWTLYGIAVVYTAVNVAVARALSSPLTWTMLRATRPELGDSVLYYLTARHMAWPAAVAAAGVLAPIALRRLCEPTGRALLALAAIAVTLGPTAARAVDLRGLERNALVTLVTSALPRVAPRMASEPWRSSPFTAAAPGDLGHLRGAAAGRNVLLVVLESTGAGYLGLYGAPRDPMPDLSGLARRALVVENAYAVYPESVKGLVSVLCSRYTALDTDPEDYRGLRVPSLAERLGREGYRTGLFHSGRFMYLGMEAIVRGRGFDTLEDAGAIGGERDSSFGIDEVSAVRRILGWIDTEPGRPFFATYLPIAGHHPYATAEPGPFSDETDVGRYHNALNEADRALALLRRGLEERGLTERTMLVIVADHGEAFGQHEGNFGHTLFIHEENVRVPFLVTVPGVIGDTVRVPGPASLVDVAPTVLDLLGLAAPEAYQGRSLLRGDPGMALFYTDYSLGLLGLRDGCMKFVFQLEGRRSRLFDLCRDPEERHDVSSGGSDRVSFYRRRLERWSAAQKAQVEEVVRASP